jgi:hypothetical protein
MASMRSTFRNGMKRHSTNKVYARQNLSESQEPGHNRSQHDYALRKLMDRLDRDGMAIAPFQPMKEKGSKKYE